MTDRMQRRLYAKAVEFVLSEAPLESKLEFLEQTQVLGDEEARKALVKTLVEKNQALQRGLISARGVIKEVKQQLEALTAPPWVQVRFVDWIDEAKKRAWVTSSQMSSVVELLPEVAAESLVAGQTVYLNHDRNLIVDVGPASSVGATATFVGWVEGQPGCAMIEHNGERSLVTATAELQQQDLENGDWVNWCEQSRTAFQRIPQPDRSHEFFIEESPSTTFDDVAGLDEQVELIRRALTLHLNYEMATARWGVKRKKSIFMEGPPGVGKTLIAGAIADLLQRLSKCGRSRFINVKPSGLLSSWYGQSEANVRATFKFAREAAAKNPLEPVVIFMDEIDSIARRRGGMNAHVEDRVAMALAAELDGLEQNHNLIVVAASNRREEIDPAILRPGRLGDLVVTIPRPGAASTRAILEKYLPESLPYAPGEGRQFIIDLCVSRLFAPNAPRQLGTITLQSGSTRSIECADVLSGAVLRKACDAAIERACLRDLEGEDEQTYLQASDVVPEIYEAVKGAAAVITPANCRDHIPGLPQDQGVARVDLETHPLQSLPLASHVA